MGEVGERRGRIRGAAGELTAVVVGTREKWAARSVASSAYAAHSLSAASPTRMPPLKPPSPRPRPGDASGLGLGLLYAPGSSSRGLKTAMHAALRGSFRKYAPPIPSSTRDGAAPASSAAHASATSCAAPSSAPAPCSSRIFGAAAFAFNTYLLRHEAVPRGGAAAGPAAHRGEPCHDDDAAPAFGAANGEPCHEPGPMPPADRGEPYHDAAPEPWGLVEPWDDAGPEHERYTGIGDENGWVLDGDEKCSPGEWSTSVDHEAPPPSFGEARPGIGEPSRLNCATCAPSECGLSILKPKT